MKKKLLIIGMLILASGGFALDVQESGIYSGYPKGFYWLNNSSLVLNLYEDVGIYDIESGSLNLITEDLIVEKKHKLHVVEMNIPGRPVEDRFIFFRYGYSQPHYVYSVAEDRIYDLQIEEELSALKACPDFKEELFFSYWGFKKTGPRGDRALSLEATNLLEGSRELIEVLKCNDIPDDNAKVKNFNFFHFFRDSSRIFFHDSGAKLLCTGNYEDGRITDVRIAGSVPEGLRTGQKVLPIDDGIFIGYRFRFYPTEMPVFSPFVFNSEGEILLKMDSYFMQTDRPLKLSPDGRHIAFIADKPDEVQQTEPDYGWYSGGEHGIVILRIGEAD